MHTVVQGQTLATIGGPPCETWSAARFRELLNLAPGKKQPRPIRSSVELWGLKKLTSAEQRAIELGNALLLAMIKLLHVSWLHGTSTLMEHPSFPDRIAPEKLPPSSELLPELQDLTSKPGIQLVRFHQCMLGAPSQKPTTFHLVNLQEVSVEIMKQENSCLCILGSRTASQASESAHKYEPLQGLDEEGQFKTAPAKQYPPRMNEVIA